jgi:hypothetical protein
MGGGVVEGGGEVLKVEVWKVLRLGEVDEMKLSKGERKWLSRSGGYLGSKILEVEEGDA